MISSYLKMIEWASKKISQIVTVSFNVFFCAKCSVTAPIIVVTEAASVKIQNKDKIPKTPKKLFVRLFIEKNYYWIKFKKIFELLNWLNFFSHFKHSIHENQFVIKNDKFEFLIEFFAIRRQFKRKEKIKPRRRLK